MAFWLANLGSYGLYEPKMPFAAYMSDPKGWRHECWTKVAPRTCCNFAVG
jgi:hypothetical protein